MYNSQTTNRLVNEKSPYLLQHAHNPVNWFPWSDEAFTKAREENKPVFLSIGYSACHWCHVMEEESFKDTEVAELLNNYFVSVKVDREERPDIDDIYMEFCESLTGSGGWPLTILLTPDQKPFYAGTYFPKWSNENLIGLMDLLTAVNQLWTENKSELLNSADEIVYALKETLESKEHKEMDLDIVMAAYDNLEDSFDEKYGGFGNAPKFPMPANLLFLLRYGDFYSNRKAFDMVETTLIQMYKGGIFDHIGYGFSRYATDRTWLIPHFEKMLYDNALMIMVYAEAYQLTHKEIYKEIAEKIIFFLLTEMRSDDGAFFTSVDADSEGEEGKFYLWTKAEIDKVLNQDEADFICKYYNITDEGNFNHQNILNLIHFDETDFLNEDIKKVDDIRVKLYNEREKRVHPNIDTKILSSANSLAVSALALAGRVFGNNEYTEYAETAFAFIYSHLLTKEKRLLISYCDGIAKNNGSLSDYGFFIWALTELFLTTGKDDYIVQAMNFNTRVLELFEDEVNNGFYLIGRDSEELVINTRPIYDTAIPSANSLTIMNLLRLSEITDNIGFSRLVQRQFTHFYGKISKAPAASIYALAGYLYYKAPKRKIVLVADTMNEPVKNAMNGFYSKYLPFSTLVVLYDHTITDTPYFTDYGRFTAEIACYICKEYKCDKPIYGEQDILDRINELEDMNVEEYQIPNKETGIRDAVPPANI